MYGVPVSGTGAPHPMSAADVAAWGQTVAPTSATAVFPPDQLPDGEQPSDYSRATVYYFDGQGRVVNTRAPGGAGSGARIATSEYDEHDNVTRELGPQNRLRALAGAAPGPLYTQRTYSADGLALLEELGPLRQVELGSGEVVEARQHAITTYDEGAPAEGGPYRLPTTIKVGAQVPGRTADEDVRVTRNEYGDQSSDGVANIGWTLRTPTVVVTDADAGGLQLTHRTVYSSKGLVVEKRMPSNPAGGDASATRTVYYSGGPNSDHPECGGKVWWTNLPCKTLPVAQPATAGMPDLAVTTYEYNRLNQVTTRTETVGSATRTSTTMYDAAGRTVSESVQASEGEPRPATTTVYSDATGLPTTTSTVDGAVARTITRGYDSLGRLTSYTDADDVTSTTSYDLLGRPVATFDGKGSQTRSYDPTSGLLLSDRRALPAPRETTRRMERGRPYSSSGGNSGAALRSRAVVRPVARQPLRVGGRQPGQLRRGGRAFPGLQRRAGTDDCGGGCKPRGGVSQHAIRREVESAARDVAQREALRYCHGGNYCTREQMQANEQEPFTAVVGGEDTAEIDSIGTPQMWGCSTRSTSSSGVSRPLAAPRKRAPSAP